MGTLWGAHEDGLIYRPKGMKQRTFDRLYDKACALGRIADACWLWRLRAIPGMQEALDELVESGDESLIDLPRSSER